MVNVRTSILRTLIYSDIFDYPLKKEEIWKFLISEKNIKRQEFEKELPNFLGAKLVHPGGGDFYCLSGREAIINTRIKRLKESREKIKAAGKIVRYLSFIPTVLFIGISGGLALENADEKDDIDLFIITSKGNLWITRLILVFLLILMGQYRGRGKKKSKKVCLNMLIDEESLELETTRQNLYTAHEIVQLKPLFNRENIYEKLVSSNKWLLKYLPNGIDRIKNQESRIKEIKHPLFIFERLAKIVQILYMKKHRTSEIISDHFMAFHPFDYKDFVLKEYNKRLKRYGI